MVILLLRAVSRMEWDNVCVNAWYLVSAEWLFKKRKSKGLMTNAKNTVWIPTSTYICVTLSAGCLLFAFPHLQDLCKEEAIEGHWVGKEALWQRRWSPISHLWGIWLSKLCQVLCVQRCEWPMDLLKTCSQSARDWGRQLILLSHSRIFFFLSQC